MPIRVTLDQLIVKRGLKARDLAQQVGLSETQLSLFRSGKVKGIRFRTLARLCAALECRPRDLLDYDFDSPLMTRVAGPVFERIANTMVDAFVARARQTVYHALHTESPLACDPPQPPDPNLAHLPHGNHPL